jgi:hypothetical protein
LSAEDNNNYNNDDDNLTPSPSNPTYNDGLTEDQKRMGRAWLPNDTHFQECNNDQERLIEAIEYECLNCSIKNIHEYETPKTKLEYLEDSIKKICPLCKNPYKLNAIEQNFQPTKHNLYTPEQLRRILEERYQTLRDVVYENMPALWLSLELILSIKPILHIKDITLPLLMVLLGPPSSTKTVGLNLLRNSPDTYYTDNFTPKAFVSHNSGVKKEELEKIDMLPRMKNKLVLAPELAPLFAKKEEDLKEILGIIPESLMVRAL